MEESKIKTILLVYDFYGKREGWEDSDDSDVDYIDYIRNHIFPSRQLPEGYEYGLICLYGSKQEIYDRSLYRKEKAVEEKRRILDVINSYNPHGVIVFGGYLQKLIIGRAGVAKNRGVFTTIDGIEYTSTYHPASLNLNEQYIENFIEDISRAIMRYTEVGSIQDYYGDYKLLKNYNSVMTTLEYLKGCKRLSVDIETNTLNVLERGSKIIAMVFTPKPGLSFAFPLDHKDTPFTERELDDIWDGVLDILEDPKIEKIGHNIKFDIKFNEQYSDCFVNGRLWDTMLLLRLTDDNIESSLLSLKSQTWIKTNLGGYETEMLKAADIRRKERIKNVPGSPKSINYELDIPLDELLFYVAVDGDVTYRIFDILYKDAEEKNLLGIYRQVIEPAYRTFITIEQNGLLVDLEKTAKMKDALDMELHKIQCDLDIADEIRDTLNNIITDKALSVRKQREKDIVKFKRESYKEKAIATIDQWVEKKVIPIKQEGFKIGSSQHLRKLIYDTMKLPIIKRTKKGDPSTDRETLLQFKNKSALIEKIVDFKTNSKILTGYINPFLKGEKIFDGYFYPTFNFAIVKTGRLSSGIHTIPASTTADIKSLFIAHPGSRIVQADLSQAELRVLAALSGELSWIEIFNNNITAPPEDQIDFHTNTASLCFKVPYNKVTKKQRQAAKPINFGIAYGITADGLSRQITSSGIDCGVKEAQEYIDNFLDGVPYVKEFFKKTISNCKKHGFVTNPFGRRRTLPNIRSDSNGLRRAAERQAINFLIQSTASDLVLLGITAVQNYIWDHDLNSVILCAIHDSIVLESPFEELHIMSKKVPELMTKFDYRWLTVPMVADVEIADSWFGKREEE